MRNPFIKTCQAVGTRKVFTLSALFIVISVIFAFSVELRSPYFGKMASGVYEDQTARTLKFARNWYHDGAWNDAFLMLENPASIEFITLQERIPYLSFLPGPVVVVSLTSLILGQEPNIATVHISNLATHYLSALFLTLCAWLLMDKRQTLIRFFAALLPGIGYLMTPHILYEHQQVYFTDHSLMLPFSALLACIALSPHLSKRTMDWMIAPVLFLLILCDWMGAIAACLWIPLRWIEYRHHPCKKQIIALLPAIVPGLLCLLLFAYQLWITDLLNMVLNVARFRSGGSATDITTVIDKIMSVIKGRATQIYNPIGAKLILVFSIATLAYAVMTVLNYALTKMWRKPYYSLPPVAWARLQVAVISIMAPLISAHLFPKHFVYHDFSVLRFAPALLLGALTLLPELTLDLLRWKNNLLRQLICAIATVASYGYLWNTAYRQPTLGWFAGRNYPDYSVAKFIESNHGLNDIIFSPNYSPTFKYPTQELSISMKRVYLLGNLAHLTNYRINDFRDPQMQYYGVSQNFEIRLPVEMASLYLLILKSRQCWPLPQHTANFLNERAALVYENAQLAYYALPNSTNWINAPICR